MLAALAIAFTFMGMASEAEIRPEIVELKEFSVAGIEARTSNAKEMIGGGAIPKQWDRFFKEGILQKIPHKVEPYIFVVYTDYAGDRNGEYTYLIGAKVSDGSAAPPGMVVKKVPKGRYAFVTSAKGSVQKIVSEAWQRIWRLDDTSQLGGARAYRADFEVYDQRSRDPQSSQVDIYVGIK